MSEQMEKPPKAGAEITVRISLTFQEAPDVHTLLAMTPVRERGKLVRLALERYIVETDHPAGNVEQQIQIISTWLRSRTPRTMVDVDANPPGVDHIFDAQSDVQAYEVPAPMLPPSKPAYAGAISRSDSVSKEVGPPISSIKRWLQA